MARLKKVNTVTDGESINDGLATKLANSLNSKFKDFQVAYFLDSDEDVPTDVKHWVPTGSTTLDLAISNRPNGGYPVGRIIEITGLEASGKSLLAAHALANTQRMGGVAVFIDTENAVSKEFLTAIGVDTSKLVYSQLEAVEDIFECTEHIITQVRDSGNEGIVTIVVDSIAAASTKAELEGDYDKDGYATGKAILISKAMRKITTLIGRENVLLLFTNQLRTKLGVSFGDPYTTGSGGKAIAFHASVRLRLKSIGQLKGKDAGKKDVIVGISTEAKVIKNRVGPPMKTASFDIRFESGIDDYAGWLKAIKDYSLAKQGGAWYTWTNPDTNEEIKFQSAELPGLLTTNTEFKEKLYHQICENTIMKYKSKDDVVTLEETELDTESPNEMD